MTIQLDLDLSRDPLRVLESTRPIVQSSSLVQIDTQQIERVATLLGEMPVPKPDWDRLLHPVSPDSARLANLVLVVDALNFCFWSFPNSEKPRWQVTRNGTTYNGYAALAVALRRAVEAGYPLWDGDFLGTITEADVSEILAGDPDCDQIPLLRARMTHLREVGVALVERWEGTFLHAIRAANGSSSRLIAEVLRALPSFRDTVLVDRREVRFYKRAQILVADLFGAFGGKGLGAFTDLHTLTAFADYKVPQVLRHLGVLTYAPQLAAQIDRQELIPPESDAELALRAATVWGVELLRQEIARRGRDRPSYAIDWALWQAGQALPESVEPYHRTLTVYY